MFEFTGTPVDPSRFKNLADCAYCLLWHDGPQVFTFHPRAGELMLAYSACDEKLGDGRYVFRYVVVPTTLQEEAALEDAAVDLYDAVRLKPVGWVVEFESRRESPSRAWEVDPSSLPEGATTRRGAWCSNRR